MSRDYSQEALLDLKVWADDPRGVPFWDALREMFRDGISDMRGRARAGDAVRLAYIAAHVDTIEEVLQLTSLIIENHEKKDGEGEKGA